MLTRLTGKEQEGDWIPIKDASFPVPFSHGLEYNSPAHGVWNIVHMGMLIPGAHQIYVCGANCVRGVVLTAAEMNTADRFSTLSIEEEDLFRGDTEENIIRGVEEILKKLPYKPTAVLLFTVCVHHFMGCDIPYIYRELRRRMPEYLFVECYMDPIMQKEGLTPDQKLRHSMLSFLEENKLQEKQVSFLGSDFPLEENSEIFTLLEENGWCWKQSPSCENFEEYKRLSDSSLYIVTYPLAQYAGEQISRRLHRVYQYLPQSFSYEEIKTQMKSLAEAIGGNDLDLSPWIEQCEEAAGNLKNKIGDTEIAIDMNAVPRYLGLARFLVSHGFHVTRIYGDAFSAEEKEDFFWLKENAPAICIYPTIQARMRVLHGSYGRKVLAIGQKAAYFTGTPHFVNIVEGAGYHGISGIITLLQEMEMAWEETKDLEIIGQKGLGCECCI